MRPVKIKNIKFNVHISQSSNILLMSLPRRNSFASIKVIIYNLYDNIQKTKIFSNFFKNFLL